MKGVPGSVCTKVDIYVYTTMDIAGRTATNELVNVLKKTNHAN